MACAAFLPNGLHGQFDHEIRAPSTTYAGALAINALVGGVTATARAFIEHKDPFRAFAIGVFGGAVHFGGKALAVRGGSLSPTAGVVVGAIGTSMVVNAGRGLPMFDEIAVPYGPVTLRARPAARGLRLVVNVFETANAARNLTRSELRFDAVSSMARGAFVFHTRNRFLVADGDTVHGLALAGTAIISAFSTDPGRTLRHESVHLIQHSFEQDAWGRPIELALRKRLRFVRRVPAWIEFGGTAPLLGFAGGVVWGSNGPLRTAKEAEADLLPPR